jgi:multidrug efflux system outer membrane protein
MRLARVALVLVLLVACAGPRPKPPASAAVSSPSGWRTDLGSGSEIQKDWWRAFGDPQLTRIVEKALVGNDDLALAATRVQFARARLGLARAEQLPNLTADGGGARQRIVDPFGDGYNQWAGGAELAISYDLDLFGRLRSLSAAARAELLATEAAHEGVRLAVLSEAARGYIDLRAFDARWAVLSETLAARDASVNVAWRRADTGYGSQLELAQARAEYHATKQLIPPCELAIREREDALSLILGDNPGPISRGLPLDGIASPPIPGRLPSVLLRRRPDIIAAEQRVVAADRSLDASRAAFLPDIQLGASLGLEAANSIVSNPTTVYSLGTSVTMPIFDGGHLRAGQDAAAANLNQAAFAYRRAALSAFREVEDSLAAIQRTSELVDAVVAQRDALAEALRIATNRYREGHSPYLDQIDAERSLLAAELNLIQARAEHLEAFVTLYQALGGGWIPDKDMLSPPRQASR